MLGHFLLPLVTVWPPWSQKDIKLVLCFGSLETPVLYNGNIYKVGMFTDGSRTANTFWGPESSTSGLTESSVYHYPVWHFQFPYLQFQYYPFWFGHRLLLLTALMKWKQTPKMHWLLWNPQQKLQLYNDCIVIQHWLEHRYCPSWCSGVLALLLFHLMTVYISVYVAVVGPFPLTEECPDTKPQDSIHFGHISERANLLNGLPSLSWETDWILEDLGNFRSLCYVGYSRH